MFILVACEESQRVCKAFRDKGHEAYSCDILDCSGSFPEWHIKGDVLSVLNPYDDGELKAISFFTMDGNCHIVYPKWDMIIAHPPCTYLTVTGNRWFNVERYGQKAILRKMYRDNAVKFFFQIVNADCEKIVIENPVGYMNTLYRKPDQIIQPYMFGDAFEKKTCLWLKGVPPLIPTDFVLPPERINFDSGKSMPQWYANLWSFPPSERSRLRSQTFPGIASAMAQQWG